MTDADHAPAPPPAPAPHAPEPSPPAEAPRYRSLPLVRIAVVLSSVGLLVVLLALVTFTAHQRTTGQLSHDLHTVFWYFDVGREHNVASWFAAGLWLLVSAVACAIALARPRRRWSWWVITAVAAVASVDEALELHERLDGPAARVAALLPFDLWFTWVLVGLPIALVVAAVLLGTVLRLPRASRWGVLVAGALFVLGSVGVETLNGGSLASAEGAVTHSYLYGTMVEEAFELVAVSLALASLLALVQHDRASGTLRLDPRIRAPRPAPGSTEQHGGHQEHDVVEPSTTRS